MKLSLEAPQGSYSIRAYGAGTVTLRPPDGSQPLLVVEHHCIVTPQRLVTEWAVGFEALSEREFTLLAELAPELVLFGSGEQMRFPPPRLLQPLAARGIGVEVMATGAACRTYEVLAAEGRAVAAALLLK